VDQDVERDVAQVGRQRQPPRCGVLAQLGYEVGAGTVGVAHRYVVRRPIKPATGARALDDDRPQVRRLRRHCHVRGDVLDPPAVT
jgi:hypothetical protein